MTLKEETVYITSDGKSFIGDREGAEKHQAFLDAMKPADDYEKALKKVKWSDGPALTRQLTVVKNYLVWKETGTVPLPPETKVKPPSDEAAKKT